MKQLFSFALVFSLLVSCNNSEKEKQESDKESNKPKINADVVVGGTFKMPLEDPVTTLNPKNILDLTSAQVAGQIFDGLVMYDSRTLELKPDLAASWTVSEDLSEYKFLLRKDVQFHEGAASKVMTAEDVIESVKYYCRKDDSGKDVAFGNVYKHVLGAQAYREGKADSISGIRVSGDTLIIKLKDPSATFIHKLANIYASILPKDIAQGDFQPIGTGPFKLVENSEEKVALAKHQNFYQKDEKGNAMPYLDSVIFVVMPSKHKQLTSFESGEVHVIEGLPINKVNQVMDEKKEALTAIPPVYELINEPEFSTQYYALNTTHPALKKKKVRQAINYAIDRQRIVQRVLKNQAYEAGHYGITPPLNILSGYDFKDIQSACYKYDPEKAKQLLEEAGHPNGEGIPTLKLEFNKGTIHSLVASDVATQLAKVLNINIEIEGVPFKQKLEDASYGRSDIFRSAWAGDYPSPETFLMNAYGENVPDDPTAYSYPNTSRYKNPSFDALMDKAAVTKDKEERYRLFADAEKLMMEDAPFVILWYEEKFKLKYAKLRNFYYNPLNYLDLTPVYIKEWTGQEYKELHGIE